VSYAYPCGHTFVGRGRHTRSYVPLVAEMFQSGRRWMDEASNAPHHVDLAQVMARKMDGEEFSRIRRRIERTRREQNWLVLAGHSIRDSTRWGTDTGMLRELAAYVSDAANEVWVAPVGEVAAFIAAERGKRQSP
jgi:hypothetical protein